MRTEFSKVEWEAAPTGDEFSDLPPVLLIGRRIPFNVQDYLTPAEARQLASELLRVADETDGLHDAEHVEHVGVPV